MATVPKDQGITMIIVNIDLEEISMFVGTFICTKLYENMFTFIPLGKL